MLLGSTEHGIKISNIEPGILEISAMGVIFHGILCMEYIKVAMVYVIYIIIDWYLKPRFKAWCFSNLVVLSGL